MLATTEPQQPVHDGLKRIMNAAERSEDLTRQLLAFARKQTIDPQTLDLNTLVGGMLDMLQRLIGENIELMWEPRREPCEVRVDPGQINQLMVNLCVNARDAISDVGTLRIKTEAVLLDSAACAGREGITPGSYVLLAVTDSGCGMTSEIMGSIFEPFFTTKDVDKGTGLGLSTVYGIVKQNGGVIDVCSEPGKGTTFRIHIPQCTAMTYHTQEDAPAQTMDSSHKTVLLVEDEPAVLKLTTMMLQDLGYTVKTALSPEEALTLADEQVGEIDLLVTDVVMPGMNGSDLAKKIRALYPKSKCLFMSGYTAEIIAPHGILDKDVCFLQKPFRINDLKAKVQDALSRK